jgi:hypothetical protein
MTLAFQRELQPPHAFRAAKISFSRAKARLAAGRSPMRFA